MTTSGMRPVRVDRERLWANLMRLKEIGGYDDAATGLRGVTATWERMARTSVVPFDQGVQDVVGAAAGAQEIAATCPTAMVVVAGEHGGVSHTPRELSRPEACGNGIGVLTTAALARAESAAPA